MRKFSFRTLKSNKLKKAFRLFRRKQEIPNKSVSHQPCYDGPVSDTKPQGRTHFPEKALRYQPDHARTIERLFKTVREVHGDSNKWAWPEVPMRSDITVISGVEKTSAVKLCLSSFPQVVHHCSSSELSCPSVQVAYLIVSCPMNGDPKSLVAAILHQLDTLIGSNYEKRFARSRTSLGSMLSGLARVAEKHRVGVLVIDDIQHVAGCRKMDRILNFLCWLRSTVGALLLMGTSDAEPILDRLLQEEKASNKPNEVKTVEDKPRYPYLSAHPGQCYLDSTELDILAYSSITGEPLGRPTSALTIDHLGRINGVAVGFCEEVYGAAIQCALADKTSHCAKYGVSIQPGDWPNNGVPDLMIISERKLFSSLATQLQDLGISVVESTPFPPSGMVERVLWGINRFLKAEVGNLQPTIKELNQALLRYAIDYNQGISPCPSEQCSDNVEPSAPLATECIQESLLPRGKAKVTSHGIWFRGLAYDCKTAEQEQWFAKARIKGCWDIQVAYEPMFIDHIFLTDQPVMERCELTPRCPPFARGPATSWYEYMRFRERMQQSFRQERIDASKLLESLDRGELKLPGSSEIRLGSWKTWFLGRVDR